MDTQNKNYRDPRKISPVGSDKEPINSPYAKGFTPTPSGRTKPGSNTQFNRPLPSTNTGATGSIVNFRSLMKMSRQKGPMTLPSSNKKDIIKKGLYKVIKKSTSQETQNPMDSGSYKQVSPVSGGGAYGKVAEDQEWTNNTQKDAK